MAGVRRLARLFRTPLQFGRLQGLAAVPKAMSTGAAGRDREQQSGYRGICTNGEGTGPPRVLITGGLGQLGSGLAKQMR